MHYTVQDTPVIRTLLSWLGTLYFKLFGWRTEGELPDIPKYVLVGAPHTSNWDFPFAIAMFLSCRAKVFWVGKKSIFRWPFRRLCMWLGGIPLDRTRARNTAAQAILAFRDTERLVIAIAPEGTRKHVRAWKKGFHFIAKGADVPIVLGFLDFKRKVGGFGPVVMPSEDIDADMKTIQEFYAGITGKNPAQAGEVI
jgi:1-acyl-sn-glycerol-3-phosphate acyltransferase